MSEPMTDADLDTIERFHQDMLRDAAECYCEGEPDLVLTLVAEVRRLRKIDADIDAWLPPARGGE